MPRIAIETTYRMKTLKISENEGKPAVYKRDEFVRDFGARFGEPFVKQVIDLGVPSAEPDIPISICITISKKTARQ